MGLRCLEVSVSFLGFLESDEEAESKGGEMLHRATVSDRALGLLMDGCRATFAKAEADGGFTLYSDPNRNQVKYRVTAKMLRAANKCAKTGAPRLRGEINPIRIGSDIHGWNEFY
jgi:hypothetical protein